MEYIRKPIQGFPGYEIDTNGSVFSYIELVSGLGGQRGNSSVISDNARLLKVHKVGRETIVAIKHKRLWGFIY